MWGFARVRLHYDDQDLMKAWAADRIAGGLLAWPTDAQAIGVADDAGLHAVAVFDTFRGDGCCSHIASDGGRRWASRPILAGLFAYPFRQCALARVTSPIPVGNRASIILCLKLGYSFEGRLRAGADDGSDEIVMGMLRGECPWLPAA